jgi:transcriptional regulator with XRE-family HTH domain
VETFAERLKRLRNEQGFTVAGLAMVVGVSESSIRQFESGDIRTPSMMLGIRLADALHVDVRFLAMGTGFPPTEHFAAIERRLDKIDQRLAHDSRRR